jgi:tetrahydromethanopterin S-methyltransferase subunit G
MSELDRIIGRLENGFESLSARLKKIERKLDKLNDDYQQRRSISRFFVVLFSVVGGAISHLFIKIFNT